MTSQTLAYQKFAETPTRSIQDTEFEIILQTTRNLKHANQKRSSDFPGFAAALRDNCRLWTTLASDVASSQNALPRELRAKIFYLCEFTLEHTTRVLAGKLSADALIEVNQAILRGLAKTGSSA